MIIKKEKEPNQNVAFGVHHYICSYINKYQECIHLLLMRIAFSLIFNRSSITIELFSYFWAAAAEYNDRPKRCEYNISPMFFNSTICTTKDKSCNYIFQVILY
jgi:hypothetical protein